MKDSHFAIVVIIICIFLLGLTIYITQATKALQIQFEQNQIECHKLTQELKRQQELNKRILEQNIQLSLQVNLKGDNIIKEDK